MKKALGTISSLFLLVLLFTGTAVHAQTTTSSSSLCQSTNPGSTEYLNLGCDHDFLLQNNLLNAACEQTTVNSQRWNSLGCVGTGVPGQVSNGSGASANPFPIAGDNLNTNSAQNASAGTGGNVSTSASNTCSTVQFKSLVDILFWIKCLITSLFIPLIFSLAFVFFLWGVLRFMMASDNAKKQESRKYIWYGLIGLFVMVTVWGIIKLAAGVFGVDAGVPYFPTTYLDKSTSGN